MEMMLLDVMKTIETLQINMESLAKSTELEEVKKNLKFYTPLHMIKELREDFSDLTKVTDFTHLKQIVNEIEVQLNGIISRDELITRLTVFDSERRGELKDRPTIG